MVRFVSPLVVRFWSVFGPANRFAPSVQRLGSQLLYVLTSLPKKPIDVAIVGRRVELLKKHMQKHQE